MKKSLKLSLVSAGMILAIVSCKKETKTETTSSNPDTSIAVTTIDSLNLGNHNNSSYGCFLSLKTGAVYSLSAAPKGVDNQASVDLVYYYNSINHGDAFLGAPTTAGANNATGGVYDNNPDGINYWTTVNNTGFRYANDVSVGDFYNMNNLAELKAAWGTQSLVNYEYAVQPGSVYRFKTGDGKIGFLLIHSIVGDGQTVGTMNVSIKVQP